MSANRPPDDSMDVATALLEQLGAGKPTSVEPLVGGRNNRVFRVTAEVATIGQREGTAIHESGPSHRSDQATRAGGGSWLMKQYFHNTTDRRDRCASEWAWANFCWQHGVTTVPQPLAVLPDRHATLFEFVNGRRLMPHEVEATHVEQAIALVVEVNRHRLAPNATTLPDAAEACFSLQAHLDCVERRVERLLTIAPNNVLDEELQSWLHSDLEPAWRQITATFERRLTAETLAHELVSRERILSPSDFGFHNALLELSGQLRFIDFEYAGWDDPAKLICDFYWQQECPAPRETLPQWMDSLANRVDTRDLKRRVELLFPVYGVKWCCIVLNEFLAADRQRREFALNTSPFDDRRRFQLELARRMLADVLRRT